MQTEIATRLKSKMELQHPLNQKGNGDTLLIQNGIAVPQNVIATLLNIKWNCSTLLTQNRIATPT